MIKDKLLSFILAVSACYLVAVILISQFNLARISQMGHPISIQDRLAYTFTDVMGSYLYFGLILIALFLAFLFAHLVVNRLVQPHLITYLAVGFIGIVTIHISIDWLLEIALVAPTRTTPGLATQGIAGSLGGLVYYLCNIKKQAQQ